MLNSLREEFLKETTQLVIVDESLSIIESDNYLFALDQGSSITDFHPFFFSLEALYDQKEKEQKFFCVQIEFLGKLYYIDIKSYIKDGLIVLILQDLTEHYKSVHQIKQVRNESVINFNVSQELNKQLEVQSKFKNKFLANVSHEIRTPLNSVLGFLSVLENTNVNREQLDLISIIKNSSANLVTILEDLMDVTKIEEGRLDINNKRFYFKEFIERLAYIYSLRAKDKRIDFSFEYGKKLPNFLVGDQLRLNQILVNLLENALKYTHKGIIELKVTTKSQNARRIPVTFEVRDTGVGIPKDKLQTIFDSFSQVEPRGLFGGSGLGLSIVKQLTNLLESDLEVESVENEGSVFRFTLYMGVSHNQKADKKADKDKNRKKKKNSEGKKPRILLGEDIEINQLLIMRLFADHGGYSLDIAKHGEQVLQFLEKNAYDLIIMDITMPVMDGLDCANTIRQLPNKKVSKIPIIALTANTSDEQREEAKEAGMNAYLTKPLEPNLLFSTIDRLLNRYKRKGKSITIEQGEEDE